MFVRGRVDVVATTRRALVGRSEITCAFDDHTPDVVENQILLAATHVLLGSPRLATTVAARLRRISAMLAEVQRRLPPRWKRRGIVFDRLNRRYRPALRLAEWVLARSSPELAQAIAAPNFHEFLIDMSGIFERFVVDQLSSRLRHSGFGCYAQLSRWLDVDRRLFRTAPDLVTIGPDGRLLVLDTKYKRLGGTFRPSESDVYQVITYCVTRGSNRGVLVYPRLESNAGFSATILNAGVTLTFAPVELGSGRAALHRSLDELAIALVGEP